MICRMAVQLPFSGLTSQEQPGLAGTAHARRAGRKNKRVDGTTEYNFALEGKRKEPKDPEALLSGDGRTQARLEVPAPLSSDWLACRTNGRIAL